jgi:hypothetical protein
MYSYIGLSWKADVDPKAAKSFEKAGGFCKANITRSALGPDAATAATFAGSTLACAGVAGLVIFPIFPATGCFVGTTGAAGAAPSLSPPEHAIAPNTKDIKQTIMNIGLTRSELIKTLPALHQTFSRATIT